MGRDGRPNPPHTPALYVDDSTAWTIGEVEQIAEALIGGIEATRAFEKSLARRLHDEKSVVVTSNRGRSKHIEELGKLQARDEAKDLGIIHNPDSKRKRGLRDNMVKSTLYVWEIAGLAIPGARIRLIAAAAVMRKRVTGPRSTGQPRKAARKQRPRR